MKQINQEKCVACGACVPHCTVDAISIVDGVAKFTSMCISCPFCRPEDECPVGAIIEKEL